MNLLKDHENKEEKHKHFTTVCSYNPYV